MGRVFANGPGDRGSVPGWVIPKTQKMVPDATLLNTQHYKVQIKGKVEQSRERSLHPPLHLECSSYWKLRLWLSSLLTLYIQVVLKIIHKHVQTARNMHILFYEQAVYKRRTNMENVWLGHDEESNGQRKSKRFYHSCSKSSGKRA